MDWSLHVLVSMEPVEHGFSLVEVLVATSILAVALVGLAQWSAFAVRANDSARAATFATVLAADKIEQLRALRFGFDANGVAATDRSTDTSGASESSSGGTGLQPSPSGALVSNTTGYYDYLDAGGRSLGGSSRLPLGAAYVRRWSISGEGDLIVLQVLVVRIGSWMAGARVVAIRSRSVV